MRAARFPFHEGWSCLVVAAAAFTSSASPVLAVGQDGAPTPRPNTTTPPAAGSPARGEVASPEAQLAIRQSRVADQYTRLEKLLFDIAALEGAENPRRSALLRRAFEQSADNLTRKQLETLSELLRNKEYRRASEEQVEVMKDLKALLDLLLSEDRPERLKSDQERIREFIKEVDRLIRLQSSVQGRTEGGVDPKQLEQEQAKVAERTAALGKKMEENQPDKSRSANQPPKDADEADPMGKSSDNPIEPKPDDPKSPPESEPKPGDRPAEADPNKTPKPSEPMPMQPGEPMPGEPMPGEPMPGEPMPGEPSQGAPPEESAPSDPESAAKKRIRAAEERMREAQKRLEQAQRDASLDEQQKAKDELEKAKADLEEILRQLREEEVERMLALLESRFRKMLEMELRVYESTKRLDRIPETDRGRDFAIQANNLSNDQRKIAIEADKALMLLREEGSSVAFPETVEQMRDEMGIVGERLASLKTNFITQESEEEIIAALEELITALQKAQQDQQQRRQQDQQQPSSEQDQPLVDGLAELKMIRALQMRVNSRTRRYARLLSDIEDPIGQVTDEELVDALEQLSQRERKVLEITRDLILEKNK